MVIRSFCCEQVGLLYCQGIKPKSNQGYQETAPSAQRPLTPPLSCRRHCKRMRTGLLHWQLIFGDQILLSCRRHRTLAGSTAVAQLRMVVPHVRPPHRPPRNQPRWQRQLARGGSPDTRPAAAIHAAEPRTRRHCRGAFSPWLHSGHRPGLLLWCRAAC